MKEYQKIQTIYKRDERSKFKNIMLGEYSLPEFEYLKNNQWLFTEKVDGTNIRVRLNGEGVTFGGRTKEAQIPATLVAKLTEMFPKEKMESVFGVQPAESSDHVTLYGEGFGRKIQGGEKYLGEHQGFVLFDVMINGWWLERTNVEDIASKLEIATVPIIGTGTLEDASNLTAQGFKSTWGDFIAEGIVMRPATDIYTRKGERIIAKIKHKDFKNL